MEVDAIRLHYHPDEVQIGEKIVFKIQCICDIYKNNNNTQQNTGAFVNTEQYISH